MQRIGGYVSLKVNGVQKRAFGKFTYNLGLPKRTSVPGPDGIHGYKEMPQPAYIEGELIDDGSLNITQLVSGSGDTVTLELGNGKMIMLVSAAYTGDGVGESEDGNIKVRWDSGEQAQEVTF